MHAVVSGADIKTLKLLVMDLWFSFLIAVLELYFYNNSRHSFSDFYSVDLVPLFSIFSRKAEMIFWLLCPFV